MSGPFSRAKSSTGQKKPQNLDQLWVAAQEEWYAIPKEVIEALYDSIPRRIDALVNATGWYTKY